jgi:hypothetical protein
MKWLESLFTMQSVRRQSQAEEIFIAPPLVPKTILLMQGLSKPAPR